MQILKYFKNKLINEIQASVAFGLISIGSLIAVNYIPEYLTFFPKTIFTISFIAFMLTTFLSVYEYHRQKEIINKINEEEEKILTHKKTYELCEVTSS